MEDDKQELVYQVPMSREFKPDDSWPDELSRLYDEASKSLSAGAHTACAMVCRKLLMATACREGDDDGKTFAAYVDYITNSVLTYPKARSAIDRIRDIGNEANHDVAFVSPKDARTSMRIVTYMLNAIYALPTP